MAQWLDRVKFGNGSNGAPSTITNYHNTFTGTSGQTTGTIGSAWTWNAPVIIHQTRGTGAGQWELNWGVVSGGTTITLLYPLSYTYGTGAQIVTLHQYTGGTFSGSHTGTAWNGSYGGIVALMCNGDLTVSGTISANALGFRGASAIGPGNAIDGGQGESYAGTWNTKSYLANYSGGGGSDYIINQAGNGGGGGNGVAGNTGQASSNAIQGIGGGACGNTSLTSMFLGGGGGGASTGNDGSSYTLASGNGAGIIVIFTKNITVSGYIVATGQNGPDSTYQSGSGGAGAGGSIILKCQSATIGTNKVTASGGIGGGSGNGGNGGAGRIHIDYSGAISGTTTPTLDSTQVTTLKVQNLGGII